MKIIKLLLILLVSFSFIFAQGMTGKGIKVGANLANISGDDAEDASMKIGLGIGGYATFKFSDALSLQAEVMFSQKGYKMDMDLLGLKIETTASVNYLDVNPLALYSVNDQIYVLVGPTLGLFVSGTVKIEFDGEEEEEDIESDDMNGIDYGLIVGGGYSLGKFNIEGRYSLGLKNAYDEDFDATNTALQILIAYPL